MEWVSTDELVEHASTLHGMLETGPGQVSLAPLSAALRDLVEAGVGFQLRAFPVRLTSPVDEALLGRLREATQQVMTQGAEAYASDPEDIHRHVACTVPVATGVFELGSIQRPERVFVAHLGDMDEFVREELPRLPRFEELRAVYLFAGGISDQEINAVDLSSLTHLRVLDLAENRLTRLPTWLKRCASLESLSLGRNPMRELDVNALGRLGRLRIVRLSGTGLASEVVDALRRACSECRVVE